MKNNHGLSSVSVHEMEVPSARPYTSIDISFDIADGGFTELNTLWTIKEDTALNRHNLWHTNELTKFDICKFTKWSVTPWIVYIVRCWDSLNRSLCSSFARSKLSFSHNLACSQFGGLSSSFPISSSYRSTVEQICDAVPIREMEN